jgi:hypothetical protein
MKILVSEEMLSEIINRDLSYIEGDTPYPETEVTVSQARSTGKPNTSDDFVTQTGQYRHFFPSGWYLREEATPIGDIAILDTLSQRGIKQLIISLNNSLKGVNSDHREEVVLIVMKYLLSNIDWQDIDNDFKSQLISIIGS